MKKFLLAAGALSVLAIGAPAAAQSWGGYDPIHQRFQRLETRIERGIDRGLITRREAQALRWEFRQLVNLDARYRHDGLSRWEATDLERRIEGLSARIRYERRESRHRQRAGKRTLETLREPFGWRQLGRRRYPG